MAYLVLARKYRPKNFDSVVHQEHVTTTLKNAIGMDRVAHAHIFTGPRGTGKTTIARILAKCMNCHQGPSETPCEECSSCTEISLGNPTDIIEIDGASNNSVDQIREIRDNLQYKPSHSRRKIYIIDEVHMLSTAAFNALLKSLEEPPSHIMFLFATTEPHKVPVTIMSRCQRHDLKRVPVNILTDHLDSICKNEGINASQEGLVNIAAAAEGSVRDSMSILDQIISSSSEEEISEDHINWILGSTPFPLIKDTLESIFKGDSLNLIETTSRLYFSGTDLKVFYQKIVEYLRHSIILKIEGENGRLSDLPENQKSEILSMVQGYSYEYLTRILDLILKEELRVRQTDNIRILLELIFIKTSQIPQATSISSIIERIENLESDNPDLKNLDLSSFSINKTEYNRPEPKEYQTPVDSDEPQFIEEKPESQQYDSMTKQDNPQGFHEVTVISDNNTPEPPKETQPDFSDESSEDKWKKCIRIIRSETPSLGDLLETRTQFSRLTENELELVAKGTKFHISKLKKDKTINLIKDKASQIFQRDIKISFIESFPDQPEQNSGINETEKLLMEVKMNPLVLALKDRLNARIIDEIIYKEPVKPKNSDSKEE